MSLASGAGHDAIAIAALCEVGMLFMRCKGGISHNPAESVQVADIDLALQALEHVLANINLPKTKNMLG